MHKNSRKSLYLATYWLCKPLGIAMFCIMILGGINSFYLLSEGTSERLLMGIEIESGDEIRNDHSSTLSPKDSVNRLQKIAYLWGIPTKPLAIYFIALHLLLFGGILLGLSRHQGYLSLALVAIIGFLVILVPPFQAPDEPDHVLSYLRHTGAPPSQIQASKDFAKRIHFERIKFRPDQKFTTQDMERNFPVAWASHVQSTNTRARSLLTSWTWDHVSFLINRLSVAHQVLALRSVNASILGLLTILCCFFGNSRLTYLVMSIPYFVFLGCIVSDYALMPAFLLVALSVLSRLVDKEARKWREAWFLVCLGVMASQSLYEPRSLFLIAPSLLAVAGFLFLNQPIRQVWFRWSMIFVGSSLHWVFIDTFNLSTTEMDVRFSGYAPWLSPAYVPLLLMALMCLAFFIMQSLLVSFSAFKKPCSKLSGWFMLWSLGTLILSAVVDLPQVGNIEIDQPPSLFAYSINLLSVVATWWRVNRLDFYLQSSLFVGFGWLAQLPNWLAAVVNIWIVVALPHVFPKQKRAVSVGSFLALGVFTITILVGLAYGALLTKQNLHGRYVLSYFVLLLLPLAYGLSLKASPRVGVMKLYGYLERYFMVWQLFGAIYIYAGTFLWLWIRYF